MRHLPSLTDREIDRLLDGKPPTGDATEDLAKVVRDVRLAYVAPPAEATEARHLAAMAEAARLSDTEAPAAVSERAHTSRLAFARKGAMTRNRSVFLAAKLAAATLVAALATGGLAAAGVISLPGLPEQADDTTAKDVRDAIHDSNPAVESCAFGLEVARVASDGKVNVDGGACGSAQARGDRGRDEAERARERRSSARGGRVGAQGGVAPDAEKLRNFGQKRKTGQHGRDFGTDTAEEAYKLVPKPAPAPQSPPAADPPTGGGQETGEGFSQGGPEVGDNAAGGRVP